MEAGPDAGVRYLLIIGTDVGPAMGDARRSRAGHTDLGNRCRTQRSLDGRRNGAANDAMRARIFWMHRRVVDWLPGRVAFGRRIFVDIAVADGGHWAPEIVVVFSVEHRDAGIGGGNGRQRHETRAVDDTHLLRLRQLPHDRIGTLRAGDEPKT